MAGELSGAAVCCECGSDLSNRLRISDREGRCWCRACNERWMRKKGFSTDRPVAEAIGGPGRRGGVVKVLVAVVLLTAVGLVINFVL